MSDFAGPSAVLADTTAALAAEAERLKNKSKAGLLEDGDFKRLMLVHQMAGELEKSRSDALMMFLGVRTNVRDMSTDQLQILAAAIMGGK
jgi:hypothetical protein